MLYEFFNACTEKMSGSEFALQCEILCTPLKESFPEIKPEEMQYELLSHGLFDPLNWREIEKQVERMNKHRIWEIVEEEYLFLRSLWEGPDISIYIYPLNDLHTEEQAPTKNGVAFKQGLFLFLSDGLLPEEIKALIAHEYNHICRLNILGVEVNEILLKDSLIIEGFGEYAVKQLYGEQYLAPWTDYYSLEDALKVWKTHFVPNLSLKGVKNHHIFLFGKDRCDFPKWIGYHIGYRIVESFQKKNGPFSNQVLYEKTSDEIIAGSDFPAEHLH